MKRWYKFGIFLIFVVVFGCSPHRSSVQEGAVAPTFSLLDRDGKPVSLEQYKGQTVLLHFWATYCVPCVTEIPELEALYEKLKDQKFVVLAVSLDDNGWKALNPFLQKHPVQFPVAWDGEWKAADLYHVYRIPESYLIDPQGKLVEKFIGSQLWTNPSVLNKIAKVVGGQQ